MTLQMQTQGEPCGFDGGRFGVRRRSVASCGSFSMQVNAEPPRTISSTIAASSRFAFSMRTPGDVLRVENWTTCICDDCCAGSPFCDAGFEQVCARAFDPGTEPPPCQYVRTGGSCSATTRSPQSEESTTTVVAARASPGGDASRRGGTGMTVLAAQLVLWLLRR
eukprot:CAMPEP_0204295006 /NCGR_PEP_ID=MMETSP0468-20130131/68948_1 /ASSEMBLY_ACC=CAM_ASM_000383 /TAXON_ID=2969 /ORGANISM="Oxyrrhis marina" /LENGTH=164 /DNA_ID=CAMNT_0051273605 /DNA_START=1 /DNA_END=495 /DNA_ORIENTATION=+